MRNRDRSPETKNVWLSGAALVLPTAPNVVSGQAVFATLGKSPSVTNTPGAIINWGSFSIAADELARPQRQSAASGVLNRVVGQNPSAILGRLPPTAAGEERRLTDGCDGSTAWGLLHCRRVDAVR